jgi:hypothetical protein
MSIDRPCLRTLPSQRNYRRSSPPTHAHCPGDTTDHSSPRATHTTPHSPLSTKLLANVKPTPPPTPPRHILIPLPFPLCSPPPYSDQGNVNFRSFPHLSGARCHRRRRRRTFLRRNEWSRCARVVLRCWVCRRRTQTRGHISHPYRVDLLHV